MTHFGCLVFCDHAYQNKSKQLYRLFIWVLSRSIQASKRTGNGHWHQIELHIRVYDHYRYGRTKTMCM